MVFLQAHTPRLLVPVDLSGVVTLTEELPVIPIRAICIVFLPIIAVIIVVGELEFKDGVVLVLDQEEEVLVGVLVTDHVTITLTSIACICCS